MSRSGYTDDCDNWALICWRGAVKSAIKGKRGQVFFKELLAALDAMPEKQLITEDLESNGQFCTLGVLGNARGIEMEQIDPTDPDEVSEKFNIAGALAQEVVYMNDEWMAPWQLETSVARWVRMRKWVSDQISA